MTLETTMKHVLQNQTLELPQQPVTGKISHHSIELSWSDENKLRDGPPECWTFYTLEQNHPKRNAYRPIYIGFSTHHIVERLEPSTLHMFRLRISRPSGEYCLSPVVSVCTIREPFSGKHLHQAVNRNNEEELTTVLQSGTVDVNTFDRMRFSPLMVAAQKGFTRLVHILVKHGADINLKNSTGKDSLMLACFAGHLDIVKYLQKSGATWKSRDSVGCTSLHWAVDGGHLAVVKYMIQDGCEVDVRDKASLWTPLMRLSVINGNTSVASVLLQAAADVNVRDKTGKTPLMVAVLNNNVELVKLLLDSGADYRVKNKYGVRAADMAKAFGRQNIINLFKNMKLRD